MCSRSRSEEQCYHLNKALIIKCHWTLEVLCIVTRGADSVITIMAGRTVLNDGHILLAQRKARVIHCAVNHTSGSVRRYPSLKLNPTQFNWSSTEVNYSRIENDICVILPGFLLCSNSFQTLMLLTLNCVDSWGWKWFLILINHNLLTYHLVEWQYVWDYTLKVTW